jgi:hypothetical protein
MSLSAAKHESPARRPWDCSALLAPEAGVVAPLGLKARNRNRGTRIGCRQVLPVVTDGPSAAALSFPSYSSSPLCLPPLRRGSRLDLFRPNAALIALAAVAAYAGLSAIWAADTEAALSKCALLFCNHACGVCRIGGDCHPRCR